jgi:hypothetical protein
MGYSSGRLTAPVGIDDLQACFGATIAATIDGVAVSGLSSDDRVAVAAKVGDTFVAGGVTWTVTAKNSVNPWARFKAIPCVYTHAANRPGSLTPGERAAENYGIETPIDLFTADVQQSYEDFVATVFPTQNAAEAVNSIKMRDWNANQWARMADFAKTDDSGANVAGIGYDANAQCDDVLVHKSGATYHLQPLIPEGQRLIAIPPGTTNARFQFPNDNIWLNWYLDKMYGSDMYGVTVDGNEEWLSPIDFVSGNEYGALIASQSIRRGLIILKWNSQVGVNAWKCVAKVRDTVGGSSFDRAFADYPGAWLDLTDSSQQVNRPWGTENLKDLSGDYVFLELWWFSNDTSREVPIYGYTYKVTIDRSGNDGQIDISGVLTFESVEAYSGESVVIAGHLSYNEVTTLGLSDDVMNVIAANYQQLVLTIPAADAGGTVATIDLMDWTDGRECYLNNDGAMAKFEIVVPSALTSFPASATLSGSKVATGACNPKVIGVTVIE